MPAGSTGIIATKCRPDRYQVKPGYPSAQITTRRTSPSTGAAYLPARGLGWGRYCSEASLVTHYGTHFLLQRSRVSTSDWLTPSILARGSLSLPDWHKCFLAFHQLQAGWLS